MPSSEITANEVAAESECSYSLRLLSCSLRLQQPGTGHFLIAPSQHFLSSLPSKSVCEAYYQPSSSSHDIAL